jgi:hypothetical protein
MAESKLPDVVGFDIEGVLLWKAPLHSLCMFLLGLSVFGFATLVARGAFSMTFASGTHGAQKDTVCCLITNAM